MKKAVYPQLSVSIDRDTLREGENAALTIMSDKAYDVDREIKLVSSYQWGNKNRVDLPKTVVMPAGSTRTTAILKATDDKEANLFSQFYIQAEGDYFKTSNKDTTVLVDNDIPDFEITLDKDTVGEADCPDCITATITRKTLTDREETISLYDTEHRGEGRIYDNNRYAYAYVWYERKSTYYPNNKDYVKFAAGQTTIKHKFGIKNNQQAEGDRDVTVTNRHGDGGGTDCGQCFRHDVPQPRYDSGRQGYGTDCSGCGERYNSGQQPQCDVYGYGRGL